MTDFNFIRSLLKEQSQVLDQLDLLNERIELVLEQVSPKKEIETGPETVEYESKAA